MRRVDAALRRYYLSLDRAGPLYQTQRAIAKATTHYLADNRQLVAGQ